MSMLKFLYVSEKRFFAVISAVKNKVIEDNGILRLPFMIHDREYRRNVRSKYKLILIVVIVKWFDPETVPGCK